MLNLSLQPPRPYLVCSLAASVFFGFQRNPLDFRLSETDHKAFPLSATAILLPHSRLVSDWYYSLNQAFLSESSFDQNSVEIFKLFNFRSWCNLEIFIQLFLARQWATHQLPRNMVGVGNYHVYIYYLEKYETFSGFLKVILWVTVFSKNSSVSRMKTVGCMGKFLVSILWDFCVQLYVVDWCLIQWLCLRIEDLCESYMYEKLDHSILLKSLLLSDIESTSMISVLKSGVGCSILCFLLLTDGRQDVFR